MKILGSQNIQMWRHRLSLRLGLIFFDALRQSEFWTRAPGFTFGKWGSNHGTWGFQ